MSSALDELRFYGTLAATLLGPRYDLGRVPGPPGHPLLGNITAVMRPDYHVQMLEWANTYGGIFKFSLGFQPVVVVSDPAVAVQVLGRAPGRAIPRKCVGYKFFDLATNASGAHSFFTTSDEGQWAAVRKAAAAAFSSANVKKAFPIALRHLLLVAESLDPAGPHTPGNPYLDLTHHSQQQHQQHQRHPQMQKGDGAAAARMSGGDGSEAAPAGKGSSSSGAASSRWLWRTPDLTWMRSGLSLGFRRRSRSRPGNSTAAVKPASTPPGSATTSTGATANAPHAADAAPSASSSFVDLGSSCVGADSSASLASRSPSPPSPSAVASAPCSCGRCGANSPRRAVAAATADTKGGDAGRTAAAPAGPAEAEELAAGGVGAGAGAAAGAAAGGCSIHSHPFDCGTDETSSVDDTPPHATAAPAAATCTAPAGVGSASGSATDASTGASGTIDAETSTGTGTGGNPSGGGDTGGPAAVVDIQEHLELSLLHVFVEALFGVTPEDFPGRQVAADMNLVLEEANSRLKVPLSGLARAVTQPVAQARIRAAQVRLAAVYGSLYDVIRARGPQPEAVTDLWACLGRVRHPRTGELLGRQGLVPEIGALMMAGFDTSSHSVAWALFALAANPEAQQRVRQELDGRGLLRRPGTAAPPRLPVLDDLPQLPYLNACIDEAMRMYPVAATASVREVTEPTRVGEFVIPPGVIVWPMLYALHNSVHNWDQPDVFKPERWLQNNAGGSSSDSGGSSSKGGNGEAGVAGAGGGGAGGARSAAANDEGSGGAAGGLGGGGSGASSRSGSAAALGVEAAAAADGGGGKGGGGGGKRYMPFSDGMKSCLGQALGLMEVRTALVVLLGRYAFALDPGHGGEAAVRRSMIMSLTLKIRGGLRLVATPLG